MLFSNQYFLASKVIFAPQMVQGAHQELYCLKG